MASAQVDHWETAVYETDNWRYIVPTTEPDTNWRKTSFNTGSWMSGQGGIGYGDGDDNTTVANNWSLYMRAAFTTTDTTVLEDAILNMDYDDAYVAYINNVEVARSNITSVGPPPFNQASDGQHEAQMYAGGNPDYVTIPKATLNTVLNQGTNVLCIQVHNATFGSSDMSGRAWLSFGINNTNTYFGSTPSWFTAPLPPLVFTSSELPIVVINTLSQTIVDDPSIICNMGIINNGPGNTNFLTDPFNEYDGKIGIQFRGSSSQSFPKKPYAVETLDSINNHNNIPLFGWPADHDWVFHNPYSDKSLLRNVVTYHMGREMGKYASRTQPVEVVIDGNYEGVYIICERVKKDPGRVDIATTNTWDTLMPEITGGYILKIDKFTNGGQSWDSPHLAPVSNNTIRIQYHYPHVDSIQPAQRQYIQNRITAFEDALAAPTFTDPALGYHGYVNTESFIDFLIVNEVGRNVDGYRISSYLYKDKITRDTLIHMGPLWDFNLGFGNANYCDGGLTSGWAYDFNSVCWWDGFSVPFWWQRMLQDTLFQNDLKCRWDYLRQRTLHTDTVMAFIDSMTNYMGQAPQRNFQRWPVLGVQIWPNNYVGNTYAEEINYLKTWTTDRMTWMDTNIPGTCWIPYGQEEIDKPSPLRVYPNPTQGEVVVLMENTAPGLYWLTVLDVLGKIVQQESGMLNSIGTHQLDLQTLPAGVYTIQIKLDAETHAQKIVVQ